MINKQNNGDNKMTEQELLKNITNQELYNELEGDIADARFYYENLQKIAKKLNAHNLSIMQFVK